jgi:hypothetical protein
LAAIEAALLLLYQAALRCAVLPCAVLCYAVLQSDVDLPAGAADRVHIYFTEGSCMAITPLAAPETVTVQGGTVTPNATKQHTKVSSPLAALY